MELPTFMSSFVIDFSWEDPQAAKGPELRATWAHLKILADGVPITQVVDYRTTTIRDHVYLPLYPLAEWFATHWWSLLHEVPSPMRCPPQSYARRHNLRSVGEGYALPDFTIAPTGETVLLEWRGKECREERLRFVTSGTLHLDACAVQSQLARLIEAAVERLDQQGAAHTLLHDEWQAIRDADAEEREFCRAAAQLGLDAFGLSDEESQAILDATAGLPEEMADEFFSIAEPREVLRQSAAMRSAVAAISNAEVDLQSLVSLKSALPAIDRSIPPWTSGYRFADRVRSQLGMNGEFVRTDEELCRFLRVPPNLWDAAQLPFREDCDFVSAVVAVNRRMSPGFLIEKTREDSRRFALCRAAL